MDYALNEGRGTTIVEERVGDFLRADEAASGDVLEARVVAAPRVGLDKVGCMGCGLDKGWCGFRRIGRYGRNKCG